MSKEVLTFTVQPFKMIALRDALTSQGVTVADMNQGSADAGYGVQVSWSYAAPTLTVTIDAGFFTMGKAKSKINDTIKPFVG